MIARLLASSVAGTSGSAAETVGGRSVFYTKILPHIIQQNNEGHRSINVIEQQGSIVNGLVVPEIETEYPRVVVESKGNGFQTTVKIWEEGHICPPFYNIHIRW